MKCRACDAFLTDRENSRKYTNWHSMPEGEDRYIGLCDKCLVDTDLTFIENSLANDEDLNDEANQSDSTVE